MDKDLIISHLKAECNLTFINIDESNPLNQGLPSKYREKLIAIFNQLYTYEFIKILNKHAVTFYLSTDLDYRNDLCTVDVYWRNNNNETRLMLCVDGSLPEYSIEFYTDKIYDIVDYKFGEEEVVVNTLSKYILKTFDIKLFY